LLAEPEVAPVETFDSTMAAPAPVPTDPNSLTAIADDLGLSAGERRRLFGRNKGAGPTANVTYLNMEEEYNNNEQLRLQGQAVEHRAVKAVAPGKHSLQQLVNSAATQKEALEDAWAEGRRNKAEAGSHYGF
jgi:methylphosphotriester-DNA--protein-cysteine methyltransferase